MSYRSVTKENKRALFAIFPVSCPVYPFTIYCKPFLAAGMLFTPVWYPVCSNNAGRLLVQDYL